MQQLQETVQREHIYLSPSSPMVTSYKTVVHITQDIDIDTVKVQNIPNPQADFLLQYLWPYLLCPPPPTLL